MIWPFTKKVEDTAVETAVSIPFSNTGSRLREGMWVNASGRIGILTKYVDADSVEVTFTKADGTTLMVLDADDNVVPSTQVYPTVQVNQALISEVPATRYESVEQMRTLGYGD